MEENKVRNRLMVEICKAPCPCGGIHMSEAGPIADRILQSPDLRVELRDRRYKYQVYPANDRRWQVIGNDDGYVLFYERARAEEYCDWLNSKEPK